MVILGSLRSFLGKANAIFINSSTSIFKSILGALIESILFFIFNTVVMIVI